MISEIQRKEKAKRARKEGKFAEKTAAKLTKAATSLANK